MPSIAVVVPVFNNGDTIVELFERLKCSLEKLTSNYQVIFVDDGSKDSSWKTIQMVCKQSTSALGLQLARNFGQHAAIFAGLQAAEADFVGIMDADLQELPENWITLFTPLISGEFDISIGTTGQKVKVTSKLFHALAAGHTGGTTPITQRCFSNKVKQAILSYRSVNVIYGPELETIGFRKTYVNVTKEIIPKHKKTSYTFRSRLSLAVNYMGYRTIKHLAALCFVVFMLSGVFALYSFLVFVGSVFFNENIAPGISLIQFTVLVGFSATMLITSAIAIIVERINSEFTRNPRYIIQERTNDINF